MTKNNGSLAVPLVAAFARAKVENVPAVCAVGTSWVFPVTIFDIDGRHPLSPSLKSFKFVVKPPVLIVVGAMPC